MYKRNTEARSRIHCCGTKTISITYSEYVSVVLIIQHAMRMCRSVFSSVSCQAQQFFFSYFVKKSTNFGKEKVTGHKMCVSISYTGGLV